MPARRKSKLNTKKIARERVRILWELARTRAKENPDLARQQIATARRISRKVRESLPREIGRRVCRRCGTVLIPGYNCRIRVRHNRETHVTVTCFTCGAIRRFPVRRQR
ncbi:MAG: ribonuclease P protein component 4 [Candidatus Thorarchaeota archaeon]